MATSRASWCTLFMPRVLSVQSHVVHGYVGQKAATFPLQLLGWDVDPVNTVHFANHTGYRHKAGESLTAEQLRRVVWNGLLPNGLLKSVTHLLTGYIRSRELLEVVRELIDLLNSERAGQEPVWYLCDPVLGDNGRLYVPPEMVEAYRDILIPRAHLIIPNAYELQLLVPHETDIERACHWLHTHYQVPVIVVTGAEADEHQRPCVYLSEALRKQSKWFQLPSRLPGSFTGTGDLSAALLLAWSARVPNLQQAVEYAFSTVYHVLRRTLDEGEIVEAGVPPELALIQSAKDILEPKLVCQVSDMRPEPDRESNDCEQSLT